MKEQVPSKMKIETPDIKLIEDSLPRDKCGIRWDRISQEEIITYLEEKACALLKEGKSLSARSLRKDKMHWFYEAVKKNYPCGLLGLRKKYGIQSIKKPSGYWKKHEAQEEMRREAKKCFEKTGKVSYKVFEESRRNDILNAIQSYYPGKIRQLIKDIGYTDNLRKFKDWNTEKIIQEGGLFIKEHGNITDQLLRANKRTDILAAIQKYYHGGLRQLRIDFNLVDALPHVDKTTGMILDDDGILWTACSVIAKKIGMNVQTVKKYLRRYSVTSIKGIISNNEVALYNEIEALALLESIKTGNSLKIDSTEANEWMKDLLDEEKI